MSSFQSVYYDLCSLNQQPMCTAVILYYNFETPAILHVSKQCNEVPHLSQIGLCCTCVWMLLFQCWSRGNQREKGLV